MSSKAGLRQSAGLPLERRVLSKDPSHRVPIGTYAITGRSPVYDSGNVDCPSSGPVTLTVGATIRVLVACQES